MSLEMRVFRLIERWPGIGCEDISIGLDLFVTESSAMSSMLRRLAKAGAIRGEGNNLNRRYYAVDVSAVRVKRAQGGWKNRRVRKEAA